MPVPGVVVVPPPVEPWAPTLAVTVAFVDVRSTAVAMPFASDVAKVGSSVPPVVTKVTGADVNGLPLMSMIEAAIVDDPPSAGMRLGDAVTFTRPTAAVPTAILTAFAPVALAPPEIAEIVAVPFAVPALNVTTACPFASVSAAEGSTVPSVVEKVMRVPLCGGVPDASMIWAISVVDPLTGSAVVEAVSVINDPEGARSGTLSHADVSAARTQTTAIPSKREWGRVTIGTINILIPWT